MGKKPSWFRRRIEEIRRAARRRARYVERPKARILEPKLMKELIQLKDPKLRQSVLSQIISLGKRDSLKRNRLVSSLTSYSAKPSEMHRNAKQIGIDEREMFEIMNKNGWPRQSIVNELRRAGYGDPVIKRITGFEDLSEGALAPTQTEKINRWWKEKFTERTLEIIKEEEKKKGETPSFIEDLVLHKLSQRKAMYHTLNNWLESRGLDIRRPNGELDEEKFSAALNQFLREQKLKIRRGVTQADLDMLRNFWQRQG